MISYDTLVLYFLVPIFSLLYFGWIVLSVVTTQKEITQKETSGYIKATILICAKNEALSLKKFLPLFLHQQYPDLEILVINHQSEDNSEQILQDFKKSYPQLNFINLGKDSNQYIDKKQALYEGFKSASGDIILMSDADCAPSSDTWAATMIEYFKDNKVSIVAGWAPMNVGESFLDNIIQFETANTFYLMNIFNNMGKPFMATGRNMAIRKSLVQEAYWEKYKNIGYGDDDMLVKEYARAGNMIVCSQPEGVVFSEPKKNWKDWWIQKVRHQKAGIHYDKGVLVALALYHSLFLMRLLVLFLLIPCVIKNYILIYLPVLIIILSWIQFRTLENITRKGIGFSKYFMLQHLMIIYYFVFPIVAFFYKKNIWQRNTPYQ